MGPFLFLSFYRRVSHSKWLASFFFPPFCVCVCCVVFSPLSRRQKQFGESLKNDPVGPQRDKKKGGLKGGKEKCKRVPRDNREWPRSINSLKIEHTAPIFFLVF